MYVVAITRWGRPLEEEAPELAPLLGLVVYDAKLRLGGPEPVIFAREPDVARARELLALLRSRGHGAVACELAYVPSSEQMAAPRTYAFGPEAFTVHDPAWGERSLPYGDILALVHAATAASEQSTTVTKTKKFSLGRAVLSGGLVMNKKTTKEAHTEADTREQVVYVVRVDGRDPLLLRETRLRHQGLGERARPTVLENLALLVELLRARAPGALYDDRLLRRPRKATSLSVSGTATARTSASSNASDVDLAVHVLAVAHRQGQL